MNFKLQRLFTATLMAFCLGSLAQDSLQDAVSGGDAQALVRALNQQDPDYRISPELLQQMCDQPEMLAAALAWVYGERPADAATPTKVGGGPIRETTPRPTPPAAGRSLQGDRIMVALDSLHRAEQKHGPEGTDARFDAQNRLLQTIFDPENRMDSAAYTKHYGKEKLPDWVAGIMDVAAKTQILPVLRFDIDKKLSFTLTARDLGVKVHVALYMVHNMPEEVEHFDLRQELMAYDSTYKLTYMPENDDFELTMIGKPGRNMLRLYKEIGNDMVALYPGKWAFRLRFTTGRNQLRSDQIHYFEVQAGKEYDLQLGRGEQTGSVDMNVVERQ